MSVEIRKVVRYVEDVFIEGKPGVPVRTVAVAAVLPNPWAGRGFVEDLRPEILAIAPGLGRILVDALLELCGGGDRVEAYGKAAIVGTGGEVEHASALIHTLRFGNVFREAVGGTAYLSFTNSRGGPGCPVVIPMMHKIDYKAPKGGPRKPIEPVYPRAAKEPVVRLKRERRICVR